MSGPRKAPGFKAAAQHKQMCHRTWQTRTTEETRSKVSTRHNLSHGSLAKDGKNSSAGACLRLLGKEGHREARW
jgi:hypothetical protein